LKRRFLFPFLISALPVLAAAAAFSPPPEPTSEAYRGMDAVRAGAVEPPVTVLHSGDKAPDFWYETEDGAGLRLHDLLEHNHVLLVFQPGADQLAVLERERPALLKRGVMPVAILDRSPRSCWALARRLELHFTVIPDARAVIGAQFSVLGARTHHTEAALFVVDRKGRLRAAERDGVPDGNFLALASAALALPAPEAPVPSSAR
jgi:peroxiredoxin